jgi:hypothetical protein
MTPEDRVWRLDWWTDGESLALRDDEREPKGRLRGSTSGWFALQGAMGSSEEKACSVVSPTSSLTDSS